jgi:putative molybdopterin biosynthesis protein
MKHMNQDQFLDVIDRDEAERRFRAVLDLHPLETEDIALACALNRILADDVVAPLDVPSFDRSNVDGYAVRAEDTFGASEEGPLSLRLNAEVLATGIAPQEPVELGTATAIATGAVIPRGADAVVMVEYTDTTESRLLLRRPVAPGANVCFAGTDMGRGETALRRGRLLTSRETGVLAALGLARVSVVRRPCVAIISTGDELIAPGDPMRPGLIYDSNAIILADDVRELGGEPVPFGIVPDDRAALEATIRRALAFDVVLLSGGTSKGAGDLSYRVVADLGRPGIVAHGVALKPGKPLCLAVIAQDGRRPVPVAVLPGFPTSAIFTFREFVAPVIGALAGRQDKTDAVATAIMPMRVNSERGRTEYLLVGLVQGVGEKGENSNTGPRFAVPGPHSRSGMTPLVAYPMGKGSGSVTTISCADGFIVIPRQREYLEEGETVQVHLLSDRVQPTDLVVIGSHCVGLDYLLGRLQEQGWRSKFLAVGSTGGLAAARRGECDLAGVHLLDRKTNTYNRPYLGDELLLISGYGRLQGVVYRKGDSRFEAKPIEDAVASALADSGCILVNRNRGSGTRVLIDQLLREVRPAGYLTEARSHNAVAAAVAQGQADWGVAISIVAADAGLGFLPLQEEEYDFVVPRARWGQPAVKAFRELIGQVETMRALEARGFRFAKR